MHMKFESFQVILTGVTYATCQIRFSHVTTVQYMYSYFCLFLQKLYVMSRNFFPSEEFGRRKHQLIWLLGEVRRSFCLSALPENFRQVNSQAYNWPSTLKNMLWLCRKQNKTKEQLKQIGFPANMMFFTTEKFPKGKQWLTARENNWFNQVQEQMEESGLEVALVG